MFKRAQKALIRLRERILDRAPWPRLDAEQKAICRGMGVNERAYRNRARRGVRVSSGASPYGSLDAEKLAAYFREKKELPGELNPFPEFPVVAEGAPVRMVTAAGFTFAPSGADGPDDPPEPLPWI
jgi:hypothetical protein